MKKFTLLFVMLLISLTCIMAQTVADYTFSTAANGSLEDMSTGTTDIFATGTYRDDTASSVQNIGFTFTFGGTAYTQFSINSNGQMQLGATAISGGSASPSSGLARLAPISGDNCLAATGKVHFKVIGSVAPRKLVVEFKDLRLPYVGTPGNGTPSTVQVWLYESSNRIDFVYGAMYNNSTSAISRGVFISTNTTSGNIGSVATIVTTPSWVTTGTSNVTTSFNASSAMTNLDSAANGSRRVFTFLPPDPLAVPNAATTPSPADAATAVSVNPTLTWSSGGGLPTGYKVYFATAAAGLPGSPTATVTTPLSYTPAGPLSYSTAYVWKIVPYNGNGDCTTGIVTWGFTTMDDPTISSFPTTYDFGSTGAVFPPTNWSKKSGVLATPTVLGAAGTGSWVQDDWKNTVTAPPNYAAKLNIYSTWNGWLISPPINVPGDDYEVMFDVAYMAYGNNNVPGSTGTDDQFAVLVGDGTSWTPANVVRKWDNAGSAYVLNNIPPAGINVSLPLGTAGIKYVAFYAISTTSNTDNDIMVDNIVLRQTPALPILTVSPNVTSWDFGQTQLNSAATKQFTITNTGGGTLTLTNVVAQGSYYSISAAPTDMALAAGESTTFTVQYLPTTTVGIPHTGTVTITDTRETNTVINLTGSCVDPTIYASSLPSTQNFDAVTVPALPLGWTKRVTDTSTYGYVHTAATGYSTPNRVAMYNSSDSASDLILITPLIEPALNTLRVKFMAYGGSGFTLQVGTVDAPGQSAVFTSFQTVNVSTAAWTMYSVNLSAYAGSSHYIAFRHGQGGTYRTIYIDDVLLEVPAAIAPEASTLVYPTDGDVALLNPTLKWTPSLTGEPATGYKVYLNDSGTFTEADLVYNGTNTSFATTTTEYGRPYFWQVVPYNVNGSATGCPTWSFSIVNDTQLAEGFEGTTFPPAGWTAENYWYSSTSYAYQGSKSCYRSTGSTAVRLVTPYVTITGTSTLKFNTYVATSTYQKIQLSYYDGITWTNTGTEISLIPGTWQSHSIDISSLAGNSYKLGIGAYYGTGGSSVSVYLDKVIGPDITPILPNAVTLSTPADLATNLGLRPTLTWTASATGGVPTSYKVYCDTSNPPTTLVATVTASPYTFTTDLHWEETYYWMVVAHNTAGDATGNTVRSFTVMADPTIYVTPTTPYSQDFASATFPPTGWSRLDGLYGGTYASGSQWVQDDWLNVTTPTNKAAKINIYGTTRYGWMITPPVSIPTTGYELKFDAALLVWNGTTAPTGTQADDRLLVVMSDSPTMSSPTILREWNNTGSPWVFNSIPVTGANYSIELSGISGTKYFAFYGESTVTENGDNDMMIDNVTFRQIPAGIPENVTLNSPINHSQTVNPASVVLTWTPAITGGNPDGYSIFVGENPIDPANEYFGDYEYTTNNTTFNLSNEDIVIGYNQTLYWAVWPFNGDPVQYPDPNSASFQVFDFTTIPDPRIISLPYTQNFDGVTAPTIPISWTAYKGNSGQSAMTSTSYSNSPANSFYLSNSSYTTSTLRLISPEVTVPMNSMKVFFYARSGSSGVPLKFGTVNALDGTGVFTELGSITLTNAFAQYSVSLGAYEGTDHYLCFQHGNTSTYQSIYIDDVYIEQLVANDLAATVISGANMAIAETPLTYNVTVTNNGTAEQSAYTVMLKEAAGTTLATLNITTPLAAGATAVHSISWTPSIAGIYSLVGKVSLAGDANATNDESSAMSVSIYSADTFIPQIGNVASTTSSYYTPYNAYYKNSMSEVVYLAHEMQATSGTIQAIVYQNNFLTDVTKPIKIWMKHTTEANVTSAFLPFEGYTLVYDGDIFCPAGVNAVVVNLDTPFAYTGGNLAVRMYSEWENFWYSTSDLFYYTATPAYPNRVRYYQADQTSAFDPILLTDYLGAAFTGTVSSNVPNTAFVMSPASPISALDAPVVTITASGTNAQLDWAAVTNAYAYRVYTSDDPLDFSGATMTVANTNTYTSPFAANAMKFYKVTAITYNHTDRNLVLDPAAAKGIDNSLLRTGKTEKFYGNKDK